MSSVLVNTLSPGDVVIIEGERCTVLAGPRRFVKHGGGKVDILVRRPCGRGASVGFDTDIERVEVER